ncbi:flavin reductase family protein [Solicola sp. PLA-1-18]|uniref:flavin reductase family protein n=1 Tax=Solicola sp. PLA-1-18 TaxID=3380532 RepID=UPI003B8284A3
MTAPLDDAAFRAALGRFASGVTVVSTVHEGVDHAMTASAFCSVSMDPPLVLVCVDRTNRLHDALLASGTWGVSILSDTAQDSATWFARRGRPLEGQFDVAPHHRGEATGTCLLDEAQAWLECRTWRTHDAGDHTVVIGEVLRAASREPDPSPLLYYRSHYGSLVRSTASEKNRRPMGSA